MKNGLIFCAFLVCGFLSAGCRSTPDVKVVPPAPRVDSIAVEGSFDDVWQRTRQALLDQKYEIYTRDKRGLFVAYSKVKRHLLLWPHRTKLTIVLEDVSPDEIVVSVETIHQRYRVSLLTYPDWRDDQKIVDGDIATSLLGVIKTAEVSISESTQGGTPDPI